MIKINLALKKQATYAESASAGKSMLSGASSSELLTSLFPRVLLPVLLALGANFGFDYYVEFKNEELNKETVVLESEKNKISAELSRFSGFEAKKAELVGMMNFFSAKVSAFDDLLKGKDATLKSLVALARSCPKDVWLTKVNIKDVDYEISGKSFDIGLVSEVMEKMTTSQIFKDVVLKGTNIEQNSQQAAFDLTARRN